MAEAEFLIGHLREQVRSLQSLLNYLEGREAVRNEDYLYSQTKLRGLIDELKELQRFASQRGGRQLMAEWLN